MNEIEITVAPNEYWALPLDGTMLGLDGWVEIINWRKGLFPPETPCPLGD